MGCSRLEVEMLSLSLSRGGDREIFKAQRLGASKSLHPSLCTPTHASYSVFGNISSTAAPQFFSSFPGVSLSPLSL